MNGVYLLAVSNLKHVPIGYINDILSVKRRKILLRYIAHVKIQRLSKSNKVLSRVNYKYN